jgi:prophage regulatory protein
LKKRFSIEQVQGHLLTTAEVMERLGVSRSTLYRGAKKGTYPKPVGLGTRSIRWRSADIQTLIERGVK